MRPYTAPVSNSSGYTHTTTGRVSTSILVLLKRYNYGGADFRIDGSSDYLLYANSMNDFVGIGTGNPTNRLHIEDITNPPLRIVGLTQVNQNDMLVVDNAGVVYKMPIPSLSDKRVKSNIKNVDSLVGVLLRDNGKYEVKQYEYQPNVFLSLKYIYDNYSIKNN